MSLLNERYGQLNIKGIGKIHPDQKAPIFNAPWEASAFAMAVALSEAGHISWSEWVDTFSEEIKFFEEKGVYDPVSDDGHLYYEIWLSTLERLITEKGSFDAASLDERHQYLIDNPVPHGHVANREPVCIA